MYLAQGVNNRLCMGVRDEGLFREVMARLWSQRTIYGGGRGRGVSDDWRFHRVGWGRTSDDAGGDATEGAVAIDEVL